MIWVLVIRTGILTAAQTFGITDGWRTIISTTLLLAIFIPLSLAAVKELNALRRSGEEPLPQIPTRRSLIAFGVFTVAFWALVIWATASGSSFVIPLLPILCTIWLIVSIRRYHRAGRSVHPNTATRPD
ncbi:hypothetical protein AC792_00495 [Arthrobacter sp. RIT-PI-e]|nr:hypothetical protein AC792_00495 [Arthrobacter sp. RIT-PI-e]